MRFFSFHRSSDGELQRHAFGRGRILRICFTRVPSLLASSTITRTGGGPTTSSLSYVVCLGLELHRHVDACSHAVGHGRVDNDLLSRARVVSTSSAAHQSEEVRTRSAWLLLCCPARRLTAVVADCAKKPATRTCMLRSSGPTSPSPVPFYSIARRHSVSRSGRLASLHTAYRLHAALVTTQPIVLLLNAWTALLLGILYLFFNAFVYVFGDLHGL